MGSNLLLSRGVRTYGLQCCSPAYSLNATNGFIFKLKYSRLTPSAANRKSGGLCPTQALRAGSRRVCSQDSISRRTS